MDANIAPVVLFSKIALEWLSLFEPYLYIQHAANKNEFRINVKNLPRPSKYWKNYISVDGYCEELNFMF